MISIKTIQEEDFSRKEILGINHYVCNFNQRQYKNRIIATMHSVENYNNIEVLKFALWCRKNDIGITMYGMLNQLPLFGIFADSAILQDKEDWSSKIYPDKEGDFNATHYEMTKGIFDSFRVYDGGDFGENKYSACIDLSRHGDLSEDKWPLFLSLAERQISDEEVAEQFRFPCIHIRDVALHKYLKMKNEGFIQENLIMCEVRMSGGCGGSHLLSIFKEKVADYELPVCTDLNHRRMLCSKSGQDYMAVQILCSLMSNWMWIAYGGSSNILSFLPIKILSLSDTFCRPNLTRLISQKRFGELGKIFPDLDTLIYCFPEEKDGPGRTDGHKPLPNMKKLTKDFSELELNCRLIGGKIF